MEMEPITFSNFTMEDTKPTFTMANDTKSTTTSETFKPVLSSESIHMPTISEGVFSPLAPPFQSRGGNDLHNLLSQREPKVADTAPTVADIDEVMMNFRINGSEVMFDDVEQNSQNYFMGTTNTRADTDSSSNHNLWGDNTSLPSGSNIEMLDTFDFLIKSLSAANNYVSMLTREQLWVLRSIRPSLLYEFLQEIVKVRSDKRMRRALPNECAFCKNNGENEECYSSHALKDWRGRVLCPVLRAFRCPRCGATGDRAHTIKYCPDNADAASDRSVGLGGRRRMVPSPQGVGSRTGTASSAPQSLLSQAAIWSSFGIN